MEENDSLSSISQSRSIAEMAEFWDTHDATDFDDQTYEVTMEFDLRVHRHYIAIDPDLLVGLRELAQARGDQPGKPGQSLAPGADVDDQELSDLQVPGLFPASRFVPIGLEKLAQKRKRCPGVTI